MIIRRANSGDLQGINRLLLQVANIHAAGRSDLFKANTKKYSDNEIKSILQDYNSPVFVADEGGEICGYIFCAVKKPLNSKILSEKKSLYIDDFCVDGSCRGKKIGTALLEHVQNFAKSSGCYNLTLNVWAFNEGAIEFYKKAGLVPQKITMEKIL